MKSDKTIFVVSQGESGSFGPSGPAGPRGATVRLSKATCSRGSHHIGIFQPV